jgi:hypothetical protein
VVDGFYSGPMISDGQSETDAERMLVVGGIKDILTEEFYIWRFL